MAAFVDFNINDTQPRDVFRDNNAVYPDRTYWIVRTRENNRVMLDSYDPTNNRDTGWGTSKTLVDLDAGYTHVRLNPVDPINGGRKRKRRSLKGRKSRRSRRQKSRRRR